MFTCWCSVGNEKGNDFYRPSGGLLGDEGFGSFSHTHPELHRNLRARAPRATPAGSAAREARARCAAPPAPGLQVVLRSRPRFWGCEERDTETRHRFGEVDTKALVHFRGPAKKHEGRCSVH